MSDALKGPLADERVYRRLVDDAFGRIDRAFADVDPDLAECTVGSGTLTITFATGVRCVISPQPPVRQIWMAFRDRAWHFDWQPDGERWMDDRGQGIDLWRQVESLTRDAASVELHV